MTFAFLFIHRQGFICKEKNMLHLRKLLLCFWWIFALPKTTRSEDCGVKIDLVIAIDASGSVSSDNFQKSLDFVKEVVSSSSIDDGMTRIGVLTYSHYQKLIYNLNTYDKTKNMLSAIDNIQYTEGGTYTGSALRSIRDYMFTGSSGDRPDAYNAILLMTDGKSDRKDIDPKWVTRSIHMNGVFLFVLGIGGGVSETELKGIASDPDETYLLRTPLFEKLSGMGHSTSRMICIVVAAATTTTTPPLPKTVTTSTTTTVATTPPRTTTTTKTPTTRVSTTSITTTTATTTAVTTATTRAAPPTTTTTKTPTTRVSTTSITTTTAVTTATTRAAPPTTTTTKIPTTRVATTSITTTTAVTTATTRAAPPTTTTTKIPTTRVATTSITTTTATTTAVTTATTRVAPTITTSETAPSTAPKTTPTTAQNTPEMTKRTSCKCPCSRLGDIRYVNLTNAEVHKLIEGYKHDLLRDKKSLSSGHRKTTSVDDDRDSSQALGLVVVIVFIGAPCTIMFLIDMDRFLRWFDKKFRKTKSENNEIK